MSDLRQFESPERQWFAVTDGAGLIPLGDCGDEEAAQEIADYVIPGSVDIVRLIDYETAQAWMAIFQSKGVTP